MASREAEGECTLSEKKKPALRKKILPQLLMFELQHLWCWCLRTKNPSNGVWLAIYGGDLSEKSSGREQCIGVRDRTVYCTVGVCAHLVVPVNLLMTFAS